jgi:hypothetical protein
MQADVSATQRNDERDPPSPPAKMLDFGAPVYIGNG